MQKYALTSICSSATFLWLLFASHSPAASATLSPPATPEVVPRGEISWPASLEFYQDALNGRARGNAAPSTAPSRVAQAPDDAKESSEDAAGTTAESTASPGGPEDTRPPSTPDPETPPAKRPVPRIESGRVPSVPPPQDPLMFGKVAPHTIVGYVLQTILVERDLEAAKDMLVAILPDALGQYDNPQWTARVYALLASVEALEGNQDNARRLFMRALTLSPAVSVEPQLGEVPQASLEEARNQLEARPEDAILSFDAAPFGTRIIVDGIPIEKGSFRIRSGDHLIQVIADVGVIGRQWITLEPKTTTHEPPPLPEIRATLAPSEAPPPLSDELQEQLLEVAWQESSVVLQSKRSLEDAIRMSADQDEIVVAACLIEYQQEAKRLTEEVRGFQERLGSAIERNDQAEAEHLVQMLSLAREVAQANEARSGACFGHTPASGERSVEVISSPTNMPDGVGRPSALPQTATVPLEHPYALPFRQVLPSTQPESVWEGLAPTAWSQGTDSPTIYTELTVGAVADTEPTRAPDGAPSPLLGLTFTPRAGLRWRDITLSGRYPLLLAPSEPQVSNYEVALRLEHPSSSEAFSGAATLSALSQSLRISPLGAGLSPMTRQAAIFGSVLRWPTPSALEAVVSLDASSETFSHPEVTTLKRETAQLGTRFAWYPYPLSALEAHARLAWQRRDSVDSASGLRLVDGESLSDLSVSLQARSWLSPRLHLSLEAGSQLRLPKPSSGVTATAIGEARAKTEGKVLSASVGLAREVFHPFYATEGIRQELNASLSTSSTGWLSLSAAARLGSEQLSLEAEGTDLALPSGKWTKSDYAGAEASLRLTFRNPSREAWLTATYLPTYYSDVFRSLPGGDVAPLFVQQVMLELTLHPVLVKKPEAPVPLIKEPVVLPPMEGPEEETPE